MSASFGRLARKVLWLELELFHEQIQRLPVVILIVKSCATAEGSTPMFCHFPYGREPTSHGRRKWLTANTWIAPMWDGHDPAERRLLSDERRGPLHLPTLQTSMKDPTTTFSSADMLWDFLFSFFVFGGRRYVCLSLSFIIGFRFVILVGRAWSKFLSKIKINRTLYIEF
jgi:hypothetical protein